MIDSSEVCSRPHPDYESQWSVKNFWSYFLGNLSGDWMQTLLNEV